MFAGKPEYQQLIYKVEKLLKSYTVYELISDDQPQRRKLSERIRIEPFQGKSNTTGIDAILRGREATRWAKNTITGLRPTHQKNVFYGDCKTNGKKELILFRFDDDRTQLVIEYYHGFYPNTPKILFDLI